MTLNLVTLAETTSVRPKLIERDAFLSEIDDSFAMMLAGRGSTLFAVGEPGLGKSALLDAAEARAGNSMQVRTAGGVSIERDLAFGYIEQCFGRVVAQESQSHDVALDRRKLVGDRVHARVQSWARSGPLLILLDDLQWADRDSLAVIAFLARRIADLPVALIGATRSWPVDAHTHLEILERAGAARLMAIPALSRAASARVCETLLPDCDDALTQRAWDVARGNPLLLQQVARVVSSEGHLPTSIAGHSQLRRTLMLSHLSDVTPLSMECARAAAVLGTRVRIEDVEAIAGVATPDFPAAFDELVGAHVVREVGAGAVAFEHDLLASSIYEGMSPAHRRDLHRRAFTHYADRQDLAAAAPHALAADLTDERAVRVVADAGMQALGEGAVATAVAQLDAAVRLAGPAAPDWLIRRQADCMVDAGQPAAGLDAYRRLLNRSLIPSVRLETEARASRAAAYVGRLDEAIATFDDLLIGAVDGGGTEARPEEPMDSATARLFVDRANAVWKRDGPRAGLATLAGLSPEILASDTFRCAAAYLAMEAGDPAGLADIEQASNAMLREIETTHSWPGGSFNPMSLKVNAYVMTERVDEALSLIAQGGQQLQIIGALQAALPMRISGLGALLAQGRLDDVLAEAGALESEYDLGEVIRPQVDLFRAAALVWQGKLDEASALCGAVAALAAPPWSVALRADAVRGDLLLAQGRLNEAVEAFERVRVSTERVGVRQPNWPRWTAGAVEAALRAGRLDEVDRLVEWLDLSQTGFSTRWAEMVRAGAEAGKAAQLGDADHADEMYQLALTSTCPAPLPRAVIGLRYGSWLRRRSQLLQARPILANAAAVAADCGAKPLEAAARAELRAAGGRRRGTRTEELTVQEYKVAGMAADGATTREMADALRLSTHTIETHLTRAYLKLGVRSKRELRPYRGALGPRAATKP